MGDVTQKYIVEIMDRLKKEYPQATTALKHENPFQLLVATILSAQCTDERVNKVTPVLFSKYKTPYDFAKADIEDIKEIIRSTGFYNNKAKNILEMSKKIVEKFNGEVPQNMKDLLTLPGVARKTANVVLGSAFGIAEGIVVDTHVLRLAKRLGLSHGKGANKVEKDLMKIIPKKDWIWFSHALIHHGRRVCKARKPECNVCILKDICPWVKGESQKAV